MSLYRKVVDFGKWQIIPETDVSPLAGIPVFLVFTSPAGLQQAHLGHIQRSKRLADGSLQVRFDIANPLLGEDFKQRVIAALPTLMLSFGCAEESDLVADTADVIVSININSFYLHDA